MTFASFHADLPDFVVDLVNSYDAKLSPPERLRSPADLEALLRRYRLLGPNRVSEADLAEMRTLRGRIREVFEAPDEPTTHAHLNAILAEAEVIPRVTRNRRGEAQLYFAPAEASLTRRAACDAGLALAMMITNDPDRLKVCASPPCRNVFIDMSRNRSRRWCSEACGGRVNVAAHRARAQAVSQASESVVGN